MLETTWVGQRVVVRYAIDADIASTTDVVGDLLELNDRTAVVEARDGVRRIRRTDVVAARLVAASTAEILALESVTERGWRAAERVEISGWLLRANSGVTGRANSALPFHRPDPTLDDALAVAGAWYHDRGLPLRVQTPLPARRDLDMALADRGFGADVDVHVLAARIDVLRRRDDATHRASVSGRPDADWLAAYHYGGGLLPDSGRALLTRHPRLAFAAVREHGAVVAIGRGAVDDGWLGVTAVEVEPTHRRASYGTAVLAALWEWAATRHNARRSYLQVSVENTSGLAFYDRLGYRIHHQYRYRTEPASLS